MNANYSDAIYDRITAADSEDVFIAGDFLDIANYETVRKSLNRLDEYGKIRKISPGIYYNPAYSEFLGEYEAPSPNNIALALARKYNWTIAPSGNTALNQLGLSSQVPALWTYVSDGPYRKFDFDNIRIEFKRRSNKEISGMSPKTALIIQAIKAVGKDKITESEIAKIRKQLSDKELNLLLTEGRRTTVWVYEVIRRIGEMR